ncbi:MAG: ECF-type sigma factor [Planctomycetota bacterium]|nr:ECF-type sigma factor [Planctomycetota bacterium]
MKQTRHQSIEKAHTKPDVENLLQRMRDGDREAAALFITGYDNRIRRRIRGKLNPAMRRLFDSQDILSTVGRRLDQYVSAGSLEANNERQLWALVFRMALNAVIDKSRMYRRLQRAEGPDSLVAQEILRRLRHADQNLHGGFEIELELALDLFSDDIDREILFQWLNGFRLNEIARSIDMAPTGVRKRWQKIRERLQERFQPDLQA